MSAGKNRCTQAHGTVDVTNVLFVSFADLIIQQGSPLNRLPVHLYIRRGVAQTETTEPNIRPVDILKL